MSLTPCRVPYLSLSCPHVRKNINILDTLFGVSDTDFRVSVACLCPTRDTQVQWRIRVFQVISSSQEEPVREIAQGILLVMQFQHFIPEVTAPHSTMYEYGASPHHADVHLEEVDLTCPDYGVGSTQGATSSQYQSPPLLERHATTSYCCRRRRKPSQLDRVQEKD